MGQVLLRAWKNLLLCNPHDEEGDDRYLFSGCGTRLAEVRELARGHAEAKEELGV